MATEYGNNQGGVAALASGTPNNPQQGVRPIGWNKLDPENVPALVEGDQIVTPSGDVVGLSEGDGLNANTEDSSTVNQARQVKAAAGRVASILCTTGSAITLTLYDNAAASATGRQIYSGSLSAGDVVIPDAAWFAHGCYAGFTGTAAFVINTSESAE